MAAIVRVASVASIVNVFRFLQAYALYMQSCAYSIRVTTISPKSFEFNTRASGEGEVLVIPTVARERKTTPDQKTCSVKSPDCIRDCFLSSISCPLSGETEV
jgi:hypothetical protein